MKLTNTHGLLPRPDVHNCYCHLLEWQGGSNDHGADQPGTELISGGFSWTCARIHAIPWGWPNKMWQSAIFILLVKRLEHTKDVVLGRTDLLPKKWEIFGFTLENRDRFQCALEIDW
jgi:hypothetical protein